VAMSKKAGQVLPHNHEAEQSVLGAMFLDGDAMVKVLETLSEDGADFMHPAHKEIFRAAATLYDKRIPIDIVTISGILKDSECLKAVGGIAYVVEVVEATPTAANVGHYVKIVRDLSVKRGLISKATGMLEDLYGGQMALEDVIDRAQRDILGVSMAITKPYEHIGGVAHEIYEGLKLIQENDGACFLSGLSTGFFELNDLTGGFQKTDLIVVAGRPSQGKSANVIQIASHMALQGYKVGIFPVEVGKRQLVKNILACQGKMNTHRFRDGRFDDMTQLKKVVDMVSSTNIFIDENAKSSTEIMRQARKMKREHGLDVIFVDHLQAMRESRRFENRNLEIDFMVSNLKDMAKELDTPVVLTSQLNREVERRTPPKPKLSDMRESGAIEQVADIIISIYRPEYYDKNTPDKGIAEFEILKNRNGTLGEFSLRWNRHCIRFSNMHEDPISEAQDKDDNVPF